jgi:hypothetical protein
LEKAQLYGSNSYKIKKKEMGEFWNEGVNPVTMLRAYDTTDKESTVGSYITTRYVLTLCLIMSWEFGAKVLKTEMALFNEKPKFRMHYYRIKH